MQPYADAEGHILLQPGPHSTPWKQLFHCTWESEKDKLERVTQALSLLATVQQVFNQVGISTVSITASRVSCLPEFKRH